MTQHLEDYSPDEDVHTQYFDSYGDDFSVHHLMLSDAPRMKFYSDALEREIRAHKKNNINGDVVVIDCGAGSGVLSMVALRYGASRVIAIEASEKVASTIPTALERNLSKIAAVLSLPAATVKSRFHLHAGMAETFDVKTHEALAKIPRSTKIILVSEWMGFYLLHEAMLQSVIQLRDRLRKGSEENEEGGGAFTNVTMIPDSAEMFVAPFDLRRHIASSVKQSWSFLDLDFSHLGEIDVAQKFSAGNPVIQYVHRDALLLPPVKCLRLDLDKVTEQELARLEFSASFHFERSNRALFPAPAPQRRDRRSNNGDDEQNEEAKDDDDEGVVVEARLHGFVVWFSVLLSSQQHQQQQPPLALNTGVFDPPTHWKQTAVMISEEGVEASRLVEDDGNLVAKFVLEQDERSYQIDLELE